MKVSEQWLREWVDPPFDSATIAEKLTLAGLEVDEVSAAGPDLEHVIVGEVIAVERHPNAERLALCRVSDGVAEHQVICGASNVRPGLKTAYAVPGAVLPGDKTISAAKIRGIESAGMLCSAAELGLSEDATGIIEFRADAPVGAELNKFLALGDVIFDIGLTPNRGDCFSIIGIARDLGVLSRKLMSEPSVAAVTPTHNDVLAVRLEDPHACSRYVGRIIKGIDQGAITPTWMQERLRRLGVRSIAPVVDITNYVMLEFGQPMHAFDFDKLSGGIRVRGATSNESLELLDGQTITLDAGTLVIADQARAIALAGVMGGAGSAVGAATSNIYFESAYFDPIRLAGVARRHGLHTDASMRFERGVDPSQQARAIERATELLRQICGGQAGPVSVIDSAEHRDSAPSIDFAPASVNRLLGTAIGDARIEEILSALRMQVSKDGTRWQVRPPPFRNDVRIEADLVEEVARIEGYDAIPVRLPRAEARPALTVASTNLERCASDALIARGYFEAITYSFIEADSAARFHPKSAAVPLANPISAQMANMRPSLWPGLINAARHNINRQHDDVRLFEIGLVFADAHGQFAQEQHIGGLRYGLAERQQWDTASRAVDFFDIKQDVEVMLKNTTHEPLSFSAGTHPALHPGQTAEVRIGARSIGYVGALHPALSSDFGLLKPLYLFELILDRVESLGANQYRPISRFPAVRRDISVVVDLGVSAEVCLGAARDGAGTLLRDLELFDEYRGQGIDSSKKSLSLGLIFQDVSSTLTDDDVDAAVARALKCLSERVGGILRE